MEIKRTILITALAFGVPAALMAQGYVDDDIYYNSSKSSKKSSLPTQETKSVRTTPLVTETEYIASDYSGDLAYYEESPRDVDEYNRRGAVDEIPDGDSLQEDFTYTRRIEKYYNPSVVTESGDPELAEYYYSAQPEINIIVTSPNYWDWWYPYSRWSWSWTWGSPWYWDSWYGGLYWGWDPFWSWTGWWGPSWRPYYRHYAGFRPGMGMRSWRPSTAGAYRPHRGSVGTTRRGIGGSSGSSDKSNVRGSSTNSTTRRGTSSSTGSPRTNSLSGGRSSGSGSSYSRPSGNTGRGGFSGGGSSGRSSGGSRGGRR